MIIPKQLQLVNVEDRVLTTLLNNPKYLDEFNLKPDSYFFDSANSKIYAALSTAKTSNLDVLKSRIALEYHRKLESLAESTPQTKESFSEDFSLLREHDYVLKVYTANENLNLSIPDLTKDVLLDKIEEWKDKIDGLVKYSALQTTDSLTHIKDSFAPLVKNIEWRAANPGKLLGISTGIKMLDDYTLGLIKKNLIIVAGRPGAGKTAFLGTLIRNYMLRKEEKPLIFFSLEMTKEEILQRLISSIARIKFQKLRSGLLSRNEWLRVIYAKSIIDSSNVLIDDTSGISIDYIESKINDQKDIGLVAIDYLQLVSAKADNKRLEVGKVAETCKKIAKHKDIPVVGLAQINRMAEADKSDKRPHLNQLKEASNLEENADIVLMLYRDKYYFPDSQYGDTAEIIIGKQRNGPVGTVYSLFLDNYVCFEGLEVRQ